MSHWEAIGRSDDWYTPKYIFDALGCTFDLDVAAPPDGIGCHVPAKAFIAECSLDLDWQGFVWMNPPFGARNSLSPWLDKFFAHGNGLALTPDRTSAPWFQAYGKRASAICFVSPKIKFERPNGTTGDWPSTGTALLAAGDRAMEALLQARGALGVVVRPI